MPSYVTRPAVRTLLRQALREDIGRGDVTSRALLAPRRRIRANLITKQDGILAGAHIAAWVFQLLDPRIRCSLAKRDGQPIRAGQVILTLQGPGRSILAAERTAVNILSHLCGIATLTRQFLRRAHSRRTVILDTRKTLPGLRLLEKYAVAMGGATNHRMRLDDAVLIKTTHLRLQQGPRPIEATVAAARKNTRGVIIEIEISHLRQLPAALRAAPDIILLDNWNPAAIQAAVILRNAGGRTPLLEASGNVTLQSIRRIAATGVERISIGRLTHSAPALDIALRVV